MASSRGIGLQNVSTRTPPAPAAPTVTGADQGLSLNGTVVELGNASILSALPQITANRHIPMSAGTVITLNSSNIALPLNQSFFSPTRVQLVLNVGGNTPSIQIEDQTALNKNTNLMQPNSVILTRGHATGVTPQSIVTDSILSLTATTIPGAASYTNGTALLSLSAVASAGAFIIVQGSNAAGAVFASQFRNLSTAAAASVVSQWFINSSVQDFEIVKYSNTNVGAGNAGGVDFVHNNTGVPASALRFLASSATGVIRGLIGGSIFFNLDRGGGTYTIGDVNSAVNATTVSAEDVSSLVRVKANNGLTVNSAAGVIFGSLTNAGLALGIAGTNIGKILIAGNTSGVITIQPQAAAGTYNFNLPITAGAAGSLLTSGGGGAAPMTFTAPSALTGLPYIGLTGTSILTGAVTIDMNGSNPFTIVDNTIGETYLSINTGGQQYRFGGITAGLFIDVDNITGNVTFNNPTDTGSIITGKGTMGRTQPWKLGDIVVAASVLDATKYLEVEVNGTVRKVALIT